MAFITALLLAYEPAKRLARARVSLEAGMVGVRLMYEIADRPVKIEEAPDAKPLSDGAGEIRFEEVSFSYRDGEAGAERPRHRLPAGQDDRAGRRIRWRQVDGPQPDHAPLRSRQGAGAVRRRRHQARDIAFAARKDRLCEPGYVPVRRIGHAQHPHGPAERDGRRGHRGGQGGKCACFHQGAAGRL